MATTRDHRERVISSDHMLRKLFAGAKRASGKPLQTTVIVLTPRDLSRENRQVDDLADATWEDATFY